MPLLKLCSYTGCNELIEYGTTYCDRHKLIADNKQKDRYKQYNKQRREDKQEKIYQDFYNSKEWKMVRYTMINYYYGMDLIEYYETGKIVQGERMHHTETLRDNWNKRYDKNNLIYLTEKNHKIIHAEYDKSEYEKKSMQEVLFELIKRFNKEFKGLV